MIDDYSNFCEMFFAAHYLPIALYKGHQYVCSAGFYDNTDPYPFVTQNYVMLPHHPSMYPLTPGTMAMSSAKTNSIFSS